MERNLLGELTIYRQMEIKPNFSDLQRKYGINRHTIAKYWKNEGRIIKERKMKESILSKYKEEIIKLCNKPGASKRGVYEYMVDHYGKENIGSLSNFRHFTCNEDILINKSTIAHPRYETAPGEQKQTDWKENMKLTTKTGEVIEFNIYSTTLGYSRMHCFIYSKGKTTEDFIRCEIDSCNFYGGMCKNLLTDNMSAIVSIKNGTKHKHEKIKQFEKDMGIKINLCKVRSPQTKGKDESANRFLNWLNAYDGEIENEENLIMLIKQLTNKVNNEVNQTTKVPPVALFEKEKEYLQPLPAKLLLSSYVTNYETKTVPTTLLVSYKGNGYSVDKQFINKKVQVYPIDNQLYIYHNTQLIAVHALIDKPFNYQTNHYLSAMSSLIKNKSDEEINKIVEENLALLDKLGENK